MGGEVLVARAHRRSHVLAQLRDHHRAINPLFSLLDEVRNLGDK
jgi:hypothetical protein